MPASPAQYSSVPLTFYRQPPPIGTQLPAKPPQPVVRPARRTFARRAPDRAQVLRRSIQVAFLLLNVWIGVRFYLFVRYFETAGQSIAVGRPPGVEGWLPIAALMNARYVFLTGQLPGVHPAGFFLLVSFVAISLAFRKAFCSWLCPIGTLSEWLWQGGQELLGRTFALPRWLDIPLRGFKYLLLGLFVYAVVRMTAGEIVAFLSGPYGLIADVKMLNFFRTLGTTGAAIVALLVLSSVLVKNFWCRYACPYGALMGLVSLVSPARIRRDPVACIDCGKCARACPSLLPVDRRVTIRSAECTGCLECVTACPVRGALELELPRRRRVPAWAVAAGIGLLFAGTVGYARLTGRWHTPVPAATYFELIPHASQYGHP